MRRTIPVLAGLLLLAVTAPPARADGAPALDPHVALGVAAAPDASGLQGWVPDSGVPWDYTYQYLAGGANTGHGWQTWNEQAQFPLWYAEDAVERGAVPVFPYYMLLQSNGPCGGCGEAEKDLAHLNDPATMRAWYDDLITLFRRLGPGTHDGIQGFGGRAIVHIEPDLSGYAQHAVLDDARCYGQCTGAGNDPSNLRASVASAGNGELAGLPDTWVGFNQAIDRLRDLYAPNVELAFHFSTWSSLQDIGRSTDPNLAVDTYADRVAAFIDASGADDFELLFHDVADRDAGYYEHVQGDPGRWWDRTNSAFPNFHRWERYVARVHEQVGKPVVVWQIPIGNQRYLTMDDSTGHYQDNKAEYFLEHVPELAASGIVALLFGRGAGGTTANWDAEADGVTNPAARCSTRGGGQRCTTETSTVPDDDGGYLRVAGAAYYRSPVPLGGANPACPGDRVPASGFTDIAGDVHAANIDCVAYWGVTEGTTATTYGPMLVTTRGQMATFLVRLIDRVDASLLPASPPDQFDDDDGHPHEASINRLAAAGVVQGTASGGYAPDAPTLRGQMATFLARTAAAVGEPLPPGPDAFADDEGNVHEASIDAVVAAGIARGRTSMSFALGDPTRRDQMASFLANLLGVLVAEGRVAVP